MVSCDMLMRQIHPLNLIALDPRRARQERENQRMQNQRRIEASMINHGIIAHANMLNAVVGVGNAPDP